MKKLIAVFLIVAMVSCMFCVTAMATEISSPEQGTVDVPAQPQSPQTGGLPISVMVMAAVLLCAVVVVAVKKAAD